MTNQVELIPTTKVYGLQAKTVGDAGRVLQTLSEYKIQGRICLDKDTKPCIFPQHLILEIPPDENLDGKYLNALKELKDRGF